jgi:hypothetical protein
MSEVDIERFSASQAMELIELCSYQTIDILKVGIEEMLLVRVKAENDFPYPRQRRKKIIMLARFDLAILEMREILRQREEEEANEQ